MSALADQAHQTSRYTFRRIEEKHWLYLTGFALSSIAVFGLLCANLWDVFVSNNGEPIYWWLIVALVVLVVWWNGLQEVEKRSDQAEWQNWKNHETLHSNSVWAYTFYQGTKILFSMLTIAFGFGALMLGLGWLTGTLDQYSTGERAIVVLLVAIFIALLWIGGKLAKR